MASNAIEMRGLSKRYQLGEHHGTGTDLRDALRAVAARVRHRQRPALQEIWSLRDIDLDVPEGSALGVIGSNGAGKSTFLKVVGNITTPTTGECRTRGRIGSLLEVGTGFHQELTGRENAYLNGAILGMSKREVTRRLDDIVEFAGLERFMDTPVKRYSSGMYLRLGFAVAAHMEADILLVDEVLAVGDAAFQRKCLGKMDELESSGRTVVFVSHNLDAVARLCPTSVWLDQGQVRAAGLTREVISLYLHSTAAQGSASTFPDRESAVAQFVSVAVATGSGVVTDVVRIGEEAWVTGEVVVRDVVPGMNVAVLISTESGTRLLDQNLVDAGPSPLERPGRYRVECDVPSVLAPGDYTVSLWLGTSYETMEVLTDVVRFSVEGDDNDRQRAVRIGAGWRARQLDDHLVGDPDR